MEFTRQVSRVLSTELSREKTLLHWKKPRQVRDAEYRTEVAVLRPVLRRIPILIAVVVMVFYGLVRTYLPDVDFPMDNLLVGVILLCVLFIGHFLLSRFLSTEYCLTEKFIRWNVGSSARIVHWKLVEQATIQPHPLVGEVQIVRLKLKGGRLATVTFPQDKMTEDICRFIREKVPSLVSPEEFTAPQRSTPLTGSDYLLLFSITVLYVYGAGYLFQRMQLHGRFRGAVLEVLMIFTMIVGPGTVGCLVAARFRWWRLRQILPVAWAFNMLATIVTMLVLAAILHLKETRRSDTHSNAVALRRNV